MHQAAEIMGNSATFVFFEVTLFMPNTIRKILMGTAFQRRG
jgi:ABC-type molybdate transport system permease subunit